MFYVASVIAVLVIDIHPTRSRAEGGTLLVIGDSLTYGTAFKNFGNVEPKLKALGTFNQVKIDGVSARNISGPAGTSENGVKTYKKLIKNGLLPSAVIVALGSNDLQHSVRPAFFEGRIRELLAVIGDIPIVWVNVLRTDQRYYPKRSAMFNQVLLRIAPEYPNLSVLDWASMLSTNPKWFAFDKLHLKASGYKIRAAMYVVAAQTLWAALNPVSVPETTIPETTIPETTTTVGG